MKNKKERKPEYYSALPDFPETDKELGLTETEAARRAEAGYSNETASVTSKKLSRIFRDNICTLFNLINAVIAVALLAVGAYKNMLFMGVVICNLAIGIIQEIRAKRSLDKLTLSASPKTRVLRSGTKLALPADKIVLGDILVLSSGDPVVCDCEIVSGNCEANESFLTGEQDAVSKSEGEKLLSGSFLSSGSVTAVCRAVGAGNYISKISKDAKAYKKANSEIMNTLKRIIQIISAVIFPLGAALVFNQLHLEGVSVPQAITSASAAIIGMIPEGLMLLTNTVLAVSVIRLARKKVLVQALYCIETLARVDILCIDKTGTITEGTMEYAGLEKLSDCNVEELLSRILYSSDDDNATSAALKADFSFDPGVRPDKYFHFSSKTKWSMAYFSDCKTVVLGAAEKILPEMPPDLKEKIAALSRKNRVLLLAHSDSEPQEASIPEDIVPVALVLLRDKIRTGAADTLSYFDSQGVDVRVISGDSCETVSAVAAQVGLPGCDKAIDVSRLDEDSLAHEVENYKIFARVSPTQKRVIVKALQKNGHIVAMTGDGVNDVLALKEADCSVAMASGSSAARNISELVLTESDFGVMPAIVDEGRRSINNIERTALLFLVKTIYSIILATAFVFINIRYPLIPVQLTLVSALTIGAPGFVLALEPNRERVHKGFLKSIITRALPGGLTAAICLILASISTGLFDIGESYRSTICVSIAATVGLGVLFFACRPFDRLRRALFSVMSAGIIIGLTIFGDFFNIVRLNSASWLLLILLITFTVVLFCLLRRLTEMLGSALESRRKNNSKKNADR